MSSFIDQSFGECLPSILPERISFPLDLFRHRDKVVSLWSIFSAPTEKIDGVHSFGIDCYVIDCYGIDFYARILALLVKR